MSSRALVQIALEMWGVIFCSIFLVFIWLGPGRKSRNDRLLSSLIFSIALLLVSDCVAWLLRGQPGSAAAVFVRVSNFLVFILNYALGFIVMQYLDNMLTQNGCGIAPALKYATIATCLLGAAIVIVSQFTGLLYTIGADNLYVRSPGYWIICVVAGVMLLLLIVCVIIYYKRLPRSQAFSCLLFFLLTAVASAAQFLFYGISMVNISMTIGTTFLFIAYEKDRMAHVAMQENIMIADKLQIAQKEAQIAQNEAQIARQQTQIVLSQIQPHFLYNALSAISILCKRDPCKAKNAVDSLSDYLRTNLDSLRSEKLVNFRRELEHTNAYLSIEKLRFGDDLQISYDIRCDSFMIPSLSLQPLVENAIRHGICKKEDGGTVTIRAEQTDTEYLVTVIDDGVGFDPASVGSDGRSHVGLESVRTRLQLLCGGSLTISSTPGVGTMSVIHLPRKNSGEVQTGGTEK